MLRLNRWMVGLDFTPMDKTLIGYVSFLSKIIGPDKIYFVHIQHNLDIPSEIREHFPQLNQPMDEKLRQEMQEEVERHFKEHESYDVEYKVIEGSPFMEMLKWSHIKNIDLLLVGRKQELSGSGVVSRKLARKVSCSVLFVPEKTNFKLKEIFVPVDFSENSEAALQEAISLSENDPEATVYCHYVYSLPSGYYTTGKSEEEFGRIMKEHAQEKFEKMLKNLKTDHAHLESVFTLEKNTGIPELINRTATEKKADIVIVGAWGKTGIAAVLLGSVTEKLTQLDSNIPLLIVKQKNKTFNFLEAIKEI